MLHALFTLPLVLAVLLPMHRLPLPSFLREWLVVAGMLVAVLYALKGQRRIDLRADVVMGGFVLLAGTVIIQGLGGLALVPAVLTYLGYILIAVVAYQAGWGVSQSSQRETVVIALAGAVLLAALYSCLIAAFQLSRVELPFELIFTPSLTGVSGNLGQPNHFNDLSWLGIAASCFLMERRVIARGLAWGATGGLVIFSVLCGSRTGFLYAAAVAVLPWTVGRYGKLQVQVQRVALIVLGLYVSVFVIFTWSGVAEHFGFYSLATRVINGGGVTGGGGSARLAYWQSLLSHMHIFGVGAGNFRFEMLSSPDIWLSAGLTGGGLEHAHNFLLDIGAEGGWIVLLVAIALLVRWIWTRRGAIVDAQAFWAINVVAVIGIHAMLEYPLHYANFLIPFCVALGLLAPLSKPFRTWGMPASVALLVLTACLGLLATAYRHYQQVDDVFFQFQFGRGNTQQDKYGAFAALNDLPAYSPYKPYASLIKAMLASDEDIRRGLIEADCGNVARAWLSQASLVNCAASRQLHGSSANAEILMTGVCTMAGVNAAALIGDFKRIVNGPVDLPVLAGCERVVLQQGAARQ